MAFLRIHLFILLSWVVLLPAARAQRVEVVGVAASFNISQSWARERELRLGSYLLNTEGVGSRIDDTGNRFSAYTRIRLGEKSFFVQPEVAYTSVQSNQYGLYYPGSGGSPSDPAYQSESFSTFGYRIRRGEVAALAGYHLSPQFYVLAGPAVAWQRRQTISGRTSSDALYQSLYNSVERVQLLAQAGVGLQVWRFDLNLRYEQSLTPYTREVTYLGQTQGFHQRTNQFILSAGVLLYDRSRRWRN